MVGDKAGILISKAMIREPPVNDPLLRSLANSLCPGKAQNA
jgi:hypothetical protein